MSNVIAFPKSLTRQRLSARNDLDVTAHAASAEMLATFAGAEIINLDSVRRERAGAARQAGGVTIASDLDAVVYGNTALALAPLDVALMDLDAPANDIHAIRISGDRADTGAEIIDLSRVRQRRAG